MANFESAFDYMIQYEGDKFVEHPADKGGPTKFGISSRLIDELNQEDMLPGLNLSGGLYFSHKLVILRKISSSVYVSQLTLNQVQWIYEQKFWLPIYEEIIEQRIANYIFDMAINHGHNRAHLIVQQVSFDADIPLQEDGIFGSDTLAYINERYEYNLYQELKVARAGFMRCIASRDPSQEVFLKGWLKRAYGKKL